MRKGRREREKKGEESKKSNLDNGLVVDVLRPLPVLQANTVSLFSHAPPICLHPSAVSYFIFGILVFWSRD